MIRRNVLFVITLLLTSLSITKAVTGGPTINSPVGPVITQTMFDWLMNPGSFSKLVQIMSDASMEAQINKYLDKRTIFAPTDLAFSQFGRLGLIDGIKYAEERRNFVNYFVIPQELSESDVKASGAIFKTVAGPQLKIEQVGKILYSIKLSNGTVYVCDTVPVHPDLVKIFYPPAPK